MKLVYDGAVAESVLIRSGKRIELHVCELDEELFVLVMLVGRDDSMPTSINSQGPYHDKNQAKAALSAIRWALTHDGYNGEKRTSIWSLQARREARENQHRRSLYVVDTNFVPLGIPPEDE